MKSILTIVLTLFMICSVSISAFAADTNERFTGKNVVIILSSGDDIVAGAGLVMAKMKRCCGDGLCGG